MSRLLRPQFSLATLLIAMAWSAVVLWLNTTPHQREPSFPVVLFPKVFSQYGWPWICLWTIREFQSLVDFSRLNLGEPLHSGWYHWSLLGDIAVGLLLVVVLTWISSLLLRRVISRLRRMSQETER